MPVDSKASLPEEDHPVPNPSPSPRAERSFSAKPLSPADPTVLTGTLGFGAVEGGCGFLETADGKRFEVIYPNGWRLNRATGELAATNGSSVRPGAVVTVRGSIANDMASICQTGPIFRATEVLSVTE